MAQPAAPLNADELVKLFEKRAMKQAKIYIKQLKDKNQQAQAAINQALTYTLVKLKSTPTGIATSLAFYKNILVSAELDYFQDSDCFDQKIHTAVQQLCTYNPKQQPEERGRNYFKQKMKLPQTQQNQRMGITFILLALQIIQNFAKWYPKDYFQGDTAPSRFAKSYQKLIKSGVKFPKYGQDKVMKADDQSNFKKNFSEWISKVDDIQQTQTKKPPAQKPASNAAKDKLPVQLVVSNPKMQKQPPKQVAASQVKPLAKAQNVQSDLKVGKQQNKVVPKPQLILQKKQPQKSKPIVIEKKDQSSKNQLIALVRDRKVISHVQDSGISDQRQKSRNKQRPLNANPPAKSEIKPETVVKNQNQQANKLSSGKKQEVAIKKQSPPHRSQNNNIMEANSRIPQPNFILNSQKSIKRSQKVNPIESPPKVQLNKAAGQQPKSAKQAQIEFVDQLLNKIEFLQNKNNELQRTIRQTSAGKLTNQNFLTVQRRQAHNSESRRIMKMQHNGLRKNNLSNQPAGNVKRSLPKTQRRIQNMKQGHSDIIDQKLFQLDNIFNNISSDIGNKMFSDKTKTLSSFRTQKNHKFSVGIYNSSRYTNDPIANKQYSVSLLKSISNLKLDEYQIPFLPQYFQPVKLEHKRLRESALHLAGCTESGSSEIFYNDKDIQVRLIKSSSKGVYILSFKNVGNRSILVEYMHKEMGKLQYYNYIRMMTQNTSKWQLQGGKYLDINFQFRVSDLNFKFLQMLFHISNKPVCLFLPITLLDQCQIQRRINLEKLGQYAQLHGKIIKSQPFILKSSKLPDFITNHSGLSNNNDMKLKGQFAVTLKARNSQFVEIRHLDFFLVNLDGVKNKCQINTIIDSRLIDNEDFAKVMLELLTFLLASQ